MTLSHSSQQALALLRDPGHFQWHVVPLFAIVLYCYFNEVEKKNWNALVAGLAFYGIEWIGEIINSLWLHFSGFAPLWGEPAGNTAYLILVGINIETTLLFGVFGLAIAKLLPEKKSAKLFGLPGRLAVILGVSLLAAGVETVLNAWGALTWDYSWWGWPNLWTVILFAYAPSAAFAVWMHDMKAGKTRRAILAALFALDAGLMIVFVRVLKWI